MPAFNCGESKSISPIGLRWVLPYKIISISGEFGNSRLQTQAHNPIACLDVLSCSSRVISKHWARSLTLKNIKKALHVRIILSTGLFWLLVHSVRLSKLLLNPHFVEMGNYCPALKSSPKTMWKLSPTSIFSRYVEVPLNGKLRGN